MFFPNSIGLSIQGNDLIISKTSQIFIKPSFESTVVKDFLLKESLDLKINNKCPRLSDKRYYIVMAQREDYCKGD